MRVFLVILLLIPIFSVSQCNPDGFLNYRADLPGSYQELEDDGDCLDGTGSTAAHTMCFDFTPAASSISINLGFNTSCINTSFGPFELYDQNCTLVGTGLSYAGLSTTSTYTWCITMRAWGGPICDGFERVCPYYVEEITLPIALIDFSCTETMITWTTASEVNNDYFTLFSSTNAYDWRKVVTIDGAGNSNQMLHYYYEIDPCPELTYYKLTQTDFDGEEHYEGIIACPCSTDNYETIVLDEFDILGRDIPAVRDGTLVIQKILIGNQISYRKIVK